MMKGPYEPDLLLDLIRVVNESAHRVTQVSLTSTEEARKHIEGIGMVALTAFVSFEAFLCKFISVCTPKERLSVTHFSMAIINLSFLRACQWIRVTKQVRERTVESESTS